MCPASEGWEAVEAAYKAAVAAMANLGAATDKHRIATKQSQGDINAAIKASGMDLSTVNAGRKLNEARQAAKFLTL